MPAPRIRGSYGKPWSRMTHLEVTPRLLARLGKCLADTFAQEAKKDFAKRGWSQRDPMKGPPIGESFSFRISGKSTIEVTSSFYGMAELTSGDIPERRIDWLTQEAKDKHPADYPLTDEERKRRMRLTGRVSKGKRMPLIIPMRAASGSTVVFRTAPLTTHEAWVHPGIARFTFVERAMRKGRERCAEMIKEAVGQQLLAGDPTR